MDTRHKILNLNLDYKQPRRIEMEPRAIDRQAPQGDLYVERLDEMPEDIELIDMQPEGAHYVVAHSETGHHHVLPTKEVKVFNVKNMPFVSFAKVEAPVRLDHHRHQDQHGSMLLQPGIYKFTRQHQVTPEGLQRVVD